MGYRILWRARVPPRRMKASRFSPATRTAAARADAGDCFEWRSHAACLPGMVNIGVQKAGTGELQTWLGVHPEVTVHGGEAHFFDDEEVTEKIRCTPRYRAQLRLRYAKFLWLRRAWPQSRFHGRLLYEKTPAYFDQVDPQLVACAVPSARLLVMLREPADRARSAYAMCQRETKGRWCHLSFDDALRRVLVGMPPSVEGDNGTAVAHARATAPPIANRRAMRRLPHLRRMLVMGHYAHFLRRWLDAFEPAQLRVLWLEQFKQDPFACMSAVESFAGLAPHPYRAIATRNSAGFYVVGRSKSSSAETSLSAADAKATAEAPHSPSSRPGAARTSRPARRAGNVALAVLSSYYAPWQTRLADLLHQTNTSLLPMADGRLPAAVTTERHAAT